MRQTFIGWEGRPAIEDGAIGGKFLTVFSCAAGAALLGYGLTLFPIPRVIGAVAALGFGAVILLRPFIGLVFYFVAFMLRPGEMYPVLAALHLERVIGAVTLGSILFWQLKNRVGIQIDRSKQTRLLLLFAVAAACAVPLSPWRALAVDGMMEILRIVAFYLMVVFSVNSRRRVRIMIVTFLLMVIWLAGSALYGYFDGGAWHRQGIERAAGTTDAGGNYNKLGTTIASALPLILLLSARSHGKLVRAVAMISLPIMSVTLIVTGSRASLLGAMAGMGALWWGSRRKLAYGALGLALVVSAFLLMPEQYQTRYTTIVHTDSLDGSSRARLITWQRGLEVFASSPLLGVGLKCFGVANATISGSWLNSHSLYLQVLGETGLFGTIVFGLFLAEVIRSNTRTRNLLEASAHDWKFEEACLRGILAGVLALMVAGVFGHSLLRRTWYLFAALDVAILRTYLVSLNGLPAMSGQQRRGMAVANPSTKLQEAS